MTERRVGKRAEQKRRWDNEHVKGAGTCADCGNPCTVHSERCRPCAHARRSARYPDIWARWHDGESVTEIAAALGTTLGCIHTTIHRMRKHGWDMPYRYAMRDGKRVANKEAAAEPEALAAA